MTRILPVAAVAAAALLTLTACGGPGMPESTADPSSGASSHPSARAASCLDGFWIADLDDVAQQLADSLGDRFDVSAYSATGHQQLEIHGSSWTFHNEFTLDVTANTTEGVTIETAQKHSGTVSASFTLTGDQVDFQDYDPHGETVATTVTVNGGPATTAQDPLPTASAGSFSSTVVCRANGLTMSPSNSPFTTTFTREARLLVD